MPLIANDRLLGAVVLQVPDYKEFLEEEVRFVGALANQAALAIDKASLYALERKTTESLRELERARSDFVAVVTHDLRTPLSVIRGQLEMLAERNGRSKLPISEATSQVLRLDQLVDRILAGVRTDRPELSLRRTRFDLRATVTAALKEVAPMARRHKLSGPRAGQPIFVRGDRRRTAGRRRLRVHPAARARDRGHGVTLSSVLVVDDERALVGMVASLLGEDGYEVVTAYDGEAALRRHAEESPDLVILDRKLPRLSGEEVCKRIRAISSTPILMLTGERGADERAKLLDLGADDYLEKPFSAKELRSRVRALLRRAAPASAARAATSVGRLRVDPKTHIATGDGQALDLTPTEFRLLAALVARPGEVLERRALLRAGWPEERDPDPEWLKAHLARLRSKLDSAGAPALANVRGVGYRLG